MNTASPLIAFLDRLTPRFITGPRRISFVSSWFAMTLMLWAVGASYTVQHHGGVLAWAGVVAGAPLLGWLFALVLNPLRPKNPRSGMSESPRE